MIEDGTAAITTRIFEETDAQDHRAESITFESFKNWYNDGGYRHIPWLELLDLKKWELRPDGAAAGGADQLIFEFKLSDKDDVLQIQQQDIDDLSMILAKTQLHTTEVEDIVDVFQSVSGGGEFDKASFDQSIRALVPGENLTGDDKEYLSTSLSSLFFAFDRNGSGIVDFAEFSSGFTILGAGSKSDKLALAFQLFDEDGDGYLSRREMWKYLRSFLIVLLKLSSESESSAEEVADCANAGAVACSRMVFAQADLEFKTKVNFEEFASWYTNGGYTLAPWLELLDLKKWVSADASSADVSAASGSSSSPATSASSTVVYQFDMSEDEADVLQIQQQDIDDLSMILAKTQLHTTEVEQVMEVFQAVSEEGEFDKASFDRSIRALVPGEELTAEDREFLSLALSNMFFAFDRNDSGEVDLAEFGSGFSILGAGSKSDKLALAFQLFDEDGDGYLSRREMWKYLRSFLIVLLKLSRHSESSAAEVADFANNGAVACARVVFAQADLAHKNKVSFEEFASWYTDGGFRLAPWLELLDIRKWPAGQL